MKLNLDSNGKIKKCHPQNLKGQRQHTLTGLTLLEVRCRNTLLLELVVRLQHLNNTIM